MREQYFIIFTIFAFANCVLCDDNVNIESTTLVNDDEKYNYIDNSIDLERTHVSNAEKFLKTLLVPIHLVEDVVNGLLNNNQNGNGRTEGKLSDLLNRVKSKFKAVYPGTYWCGDGDSAANEQQLGIFKKTDSCCRNHDNCRLDIEAGKTFENLLNNGIFTRSSCDCDTDFYKCLKNVSSIISTKIGFTYFNVLQPQCFKEDYEIVGCNRYGRRRIFDSRKCLDYQLDTSSQKKLQWFDNPDY